MACSGLHAIASLVIVAVIVCAFPSFYPYPPRPVRFLLRPPLPVCPARYARSRSLTDFFEENEQPFIPPFLFLSWNDDRKRKKRRRRNKNTHGSACSGPFFSHEIMEGYQYEDIYNI